MGTKLGTATGRFVWHDHRSPDAGAARAFYTTLMGWETEIFKAGELDYPMIKVHGQTHGGFGPGQGGPSHWLGHVAVEDVDAAASRAAAGGGTVLMEPMDMAEVGRLAAIRDQQGATLGLYTPETEPPASEGVFAWDELMTGDVEAAKRFYGDAIGWTAETTQMGGQSYTTFSSADTPRAGCMATPPGVQAPPMWSTYLATDDLDATMGRALASGASVIAPRMEMQGVGAFAMLTDPAGAAFGLLQQESE